MGDSLSGQTVPVAGSQKDLFAWPTVMVGYTAAGVPVPVQVSSSGAPVPASATGTYTYFHVSASGSLSGGIPVTAKRWAVNFVGTGTTNTFGTNTSLTGGQSFSDNATPAVAIAIACDGSTVADGFYSTT